MRLVPQSNDITSRLALGTVQFGLDYGISNKLGKTNEAEIHQILQTAWLSGIRMLDTASAYGDSEMMIGKCARHPFQIVTKIPPTINTIKAVNEAVNRSLFRLNVQKLYSVITHNSSTLLKFPGTWTALQRLKADGKVEKIGYSLYSPSELTELMNLNFIPDIVQLPFSFLDQRFKQYFDLLKKLNVEIHVRSIFLQGLILMRPESLPDFFNSVKPVLQSLHDLFPSKSVLAGWLMKFVLSHEAVDKVVFGLNSAEQLLANLNSLTSASAENVRISAPDLPDKILIPSYWPKI